MGSLIKIPRGMGRSIDAYVAGDAASPMGLVVVHELAGMDALLCERCESFSRRGFRVVAVPVFGGVEADVHAGRGEARISPGDTFPSASNENDVVANVVEAARFLGCEAVGAVGYGLGAVACWLAAARTREFSAVSCWYVAEIPRVAGGRPGCRVQAHLGGLAPRVAAAAAESIQQADAGAEIHIYPLDACTIRQADPGPHPFAFSKLAQFRTEDFLLRVLTRKV